MEGLTHRVGEGSYVDDDMSVVELFIRAKENPDDYDTQAELMNFYVTKLNEYWHFFEKKIRKDDSGTEYFGTQGEGQKIDEPYDRHYYDVRMEKRNAIYQGKPFARPGVSMSEYPSRTEYSDEEVAQRLYPLSDDEVVTFADYTLHNGPYSNFSFGFDPNTVIGTEEFLALSSTNRLLTKNFILRHLDTYKSTFFGLLEQAIAKFNETGKVDRMQILYLFSYLSKLMCYNSQAERISSKRFTTQMGKYDIYLLTNDIGLFGFNAYLYAYLHDILLIGVPNKIAEYDGRIGCPEIFVDHDFGHSKSIVREGLSEADKLRLQNIYNSILNSNLERRMKELLLIAMWTGIHEGGLSVLTDQVSNEKMASALNIIGLQGDLNDFIRSNYMDILETPGNILLVEEFAKERNYNFNPNMINKTPIAFAMLFYWAFVSDIQ